MPMQLKLKLTTLDGLDSVFHELYTEQSDKTYLLTGVEGMKTQGDIDKVTQALVKERADHKALKEKFALLGDQDPVDLLAQLDRIKELEAAAAGKIDEAKINEIVEGRLRTKLGPVERENKQLKDQLAAEQGVTAELKAKDQKRTIHDKARAAALKIGVIPEALDDILLYADNVMEITEDGRVITKDQVGVTPGVDPEVWLSEMQQKKRYWWPASQSGDSKGNGGGGGISGDNPWTATGWNITKQTEILNADQKRAEQMARSAGTYVGGPRPQQKAA
ncbi:hypothetical protein R2083_08140 [Nitrosomonas sp. Is35]|uniref:hypothetical protein n=1 Tax=Nitrosomonas sp. Is35 TaxID=3080534 RepID=UPI00294B77FA|nr:hypothetical protein [Nitrosomonas sp. Is35]MDV6347483.1 hypothetical protein [Nitrosomonas sp. Is35]